MMTRKKRSESVFLGRFQILYHFSESGENTDMKSTRSMLANEKKKYFTISKPSHSKNKRPSGRFSYNVIIVISHSIIRNFYIHIPFCRQKCPYCKFALTPVFDAAKKRRYIAYLKNEIREYFQNQSDPLHQCGNWTLYFGGWTPSVLSFLEIKEILDCFPPCEEKLVLNVTPRI